MKVTFEGPCVSDLINQAQQFSRCFIGEPVASIGVAGSNPVAPTNSPPQTEHHLASNTQEQEPPTEKKRQGRPPETPEQKALKAEKLKAEVLAAEVPDLPAIPKVKSKKITKEDLASLLQKVCEKEDSGKSDKAAGLNKVREIFARFGISRLGELDEKRYHEMTVHIEDALA